jgi:hypothetical protein
MNLHSRTNLEKDLIGDILADSHNILQQMDYFCQLLNLQGINDCQAGGNA